MQHPTHKTHLEVNTLWPTHYLLTHASYTWSYQCWNRWQTDRRREGRTNRRIIMHASVQHATHILFQWPARCCKGRRAQQFVTKHRNVKSSATRHHLQAHKDRCIDYNTPICTYLSAHTPHSYNNLIGNAKCGSIQHVRICVSMIHEIRFPAQENMYACHTFVCAVCRCVDLCGRVYVCVWM